MKYTGPTEMDCPEKCTIPAGKCAAEVPEPRHNWGDVLGCPNEGCGHWLLIWDAKEEKAE